MITIARRARAGGSLLRLTRSLTLLWTTAACGSSGPKRPDPVVPSSHRSSSDENRKVDSMLTVDSMLETDFRVEQAEQILGTPIYVAFAYRNRGPHPLSFVIGNGRSDSFRFDPSPPATALDPYYEFGGLAAITHVAPRD